MATKKETASERRKRLGLGGDTHYADGRPRNPRRTKPKPKPKADSDSTLGNIYDSLKWAVTGKQTSKDARRTPVPERPGRTYIDTTKVTKSGKPAPADKGSAWSTKDAKGRRRPVAKPGAARKKVAAKKAPVKAAPKVAPKVATKPKRKSYGNVARWKRQREARRRLR